MEMENEAELFLKEDEIQVNSNPECGEKCSDLSRPVNLHAAGNWKKVMAKRSNCAVYSTDSETAQVADDDIEASLSSDCFQDPQNLLDSSPIGQIETQKCTASVGSISTPPHLEISSPRAQGRSLSYGRIYSFSLQNLNSFCDRSQLPFTEMFINLPLSIRVAINLFNTDPYKGVAFLILHCHAHTYAILCDFLRSNSCINKTQIGTLLGNISNKFCSKLLAVYVESFDFKGRCLPSCLRYFQSFFRMPGEGQKIDRIMELFSSEYYRQNQHAVNEDQSVYGSFEVIFILSYSLIMLNVDLHNPNIKRRMSIEVFIDNVRSVDGCADLPKTLLADMYDYISKTEFSVDKDNMGRLFDIKSLLGIKAFDIVSEARQFIGIFSIKQTKADLFRRKTTRGRTLLLFNDRIEILSDDNSVGDKKAKSNASTHKYSFPFDTHEIVAIKSSLISMSIPSNAKDDSLVLAIREVSKTTNLLTFVTTNKYDSEKIFDYYCRLRVELDLTNKFARWITKEHFNELTDGFDDEKALLTISQEIKERMELFNKREVSMLYEDSAA